MPLWRIRAPAAATTRALAVATTRAAIATTRAAVATTCGRRLQQRGRRLPQIIEKAFVHRLRTSDQLRFKENLAHDHRRAAIGVTPHGGAATDAHGGAAPLTLGARLSPSAD